MLTAIETKDKIRNFLSKFITHQEWQDTDDIFALGFVNSMFAMQLVMFLEKEFLITIENEDLDLDNFRSIQAMSDFLARKSA
ncbi:phosphopantetheine-binding protein [Oscillatoria sp. CS-180]|uniref:acyl carrier protein n=1 Tax=Oscillatoria sp. CS-180 TaxID=3021720 RepID=UPI00232CC513|nr:phosphopantetheine-binding protein [Oscillatoria sp. CS-180]MDB9527425.1 phosphopantetheine-binding protein [Oscillatoria sp. CS-180]